MKILFIVDSFSGGAGNVIQILASEFSHKKYNIEILLLNGKTVNEKYDLSKVIVHNCALSEFAPGNNPISRVNSAVKFLKNEFDKINPDVIVSFLTEINILCCMSNHKKIPLIISERNDPYVEKPKIYWQILRYLTYGKANKIVVQCDYFKDFCRGKFKQNVVVIPNPILKAKFEHIVKEQEKIEIVSLGRLTEQKNFQWLIDRMANISKKNSKIKLKIYGTGHLEKILQDQIASFHLQNTVTLMGYTDSPHKVLAQADIYAMTSNYEGFPNALSEAMAVGLPSVSRFCHQGISDLVRDGENGYTVLMDDTIQFEAIILKLAESFELREDISEKAKKISIEFSTEKIVDIWEKEIKNIIY